VNNYLIGGMEIAGCSLAASARNANKCPSGYHIPTRDEVAAVFSSMETRNEVYTYI
jgi:hypothetical protein